MRTATKADFKNGAKGGRLKGNCRDGTGFTVYETDNPNHLRDAGIAFDVFLACPYETLFNFNLYKK